MLLRSCLFLSIGSTLLGISILSAPLASQAQESLSGTMTLYTVELEDVITEVVQDFNQIYPDIQINTF